MSPRIAALLLALLPAAAVAGESPCRIHVAYRSGPEDTVGTKLMGSVRDRFGKTPVFALVPEDEPATLSVRLVSMSAGEGATAYAGVTTVGKLDILLSGPVVGMCGNDRVKECADDIVAAIKNDIDLCREVATDPSKAQAPPR